MEESDQFAPVDMDGNVRAGVAQNLIPGFYFKVHSDFSDAPEVAYIIMRKFYVGTLTDGENNSNLG